jgi:hypothetical protein
MSTVTTRPGRRGRHSEVDMRGIIVFVIILLAGGGLFWALVGGCVAS